MDTRPNLTIVGIVAGLPWAAFLSQVLMAIWFIPQRLEDARWYLLAVVVHLCVVLATLAGTYAFYRWPLDYMRVAVFLGVVLSSVYIFYGKAMYDTAEYLKKDATRKRADKKKVAQRNVVEISFVASMLLVPTLLLAVAPPEIVDRYT